MTKLHNETAQKKMQFNDDDDDDDDDDDGDDDDDDRLYVGLMSLQANKGGVIFFLLYTNT